MTRQEAGTRIVGGRLRPHKTASGYIVPFYMELEDGTLDPDSMVFTRFGEAWRWARQWRGSRMAIPRTPSQSELTGIAVDVETWRKLYRGVS